MSKYFKTVMIWIVQKNLWYEKEFQNFCNAIERSGVEVQAVEVIPFSHEIVPRVEYEGKKICYGSTTLMRLSKQEGWNPGCYFNDNFDSRIWTKKFGKDCLNDDAIECRLEDVPKFAVENEIFIRPCEDLKLFSGHVIKKEDFVKWMDKVQKLDSVATVTKDTMVSIANTKEIFKEYRFYIVDKKVVTCSLYKLSNRLITNLPVEEEAIQFAEKMIKVWTPHDVFVLDVALTSEGYKVIEINCANSAGFYNCDVSKLVQGIVNYEKSKVEKG
jgi:hypothetical protein